LESSEQGKTEIAAHLESKGPSFGAWLKKSYCENDQATINYLVEAMTRLHEKHILKFPWAQNGKIGGACVYDPHGAFTEFGWKLAQHLYSAEVPAEAQAG
jgi:hypothetical protein